MRLRDDIGDADELHERLIEALMADPDGNGFVLTARRSARLREDGGDHVTWRVKVAARLAGKPFGGVQLDVSPRAHEPGDTDRVALPNSLDFAGIPTPVVEIVEVHRHAAEKLHAMLCDFGDCENTRVRDLVDLVILIGYGMLNPATVAAATRQVFSERDAVEPPAVLPPFPESWSDRYERLVADHDLETQFFPASVALVQRLWAEMFSMQET